MNDNAMLMMVCSGVLVFWCVLGLRGRGSFFRLWFTVGQLLPCPYICKGGYFSKFRKSEEAVSLGGGTMLGCTGGGTERILTAGW